MKDLLKKLPGFLFELLIVFIGVYAAFALNNHREGQKEIQSQIKFCESFLTELETVQFRAGALRAEVDSIVGALETQIAEGKRPLLDPMPELDFRANSAITQSAFSENHFDIISGDYLLNISRGLVLYDLIHRRVERFHRSAREHLYTSEPDFYLPNGELKTAYKWYFEDLKSISKWLARLEWAIEKGAVPETKQIIEQLKKG